MTLRQEPASRVTAYHATVISERLSAELEVKADVDDGAPEGRSGPALGRLA
jgi:hypothetical protein